MRFMGERRIKSSRKTRRCWGCERILLTGSPLIRHTTVCDGMFHHAYFCTPCHQWKEENTANWSQEDWDSTHPGDIGDMRHDSTQE